jgi:hypothetical protein
MPRRGSPYGSGYERDRAALLRRHPRCVWCGRAASEADHWPPLALHPGGARSHRHRSGCCRLLPACFDCQRRQGALVAARKLALEQIEIELEVEVPEPIGFDELDPVWDVDWLKDLRKVPDSAVWPRLMSAPHPRAVGSLGKEFERWVKRRTGRVLRWWQRLAARRILEVDAEGRLVWEAWLLSMARQLGKSWLLRELIMWRLHQGPRFGGVPQLIVHTGMNLTVCRRVMEFEWRWAKTQVVEVVGEDGEVYLEHLYRAREVNSQELLELVEDGSQWVLLSKDATYGTTTNLGIVDEAWKVKASTVDDGLEPTLVEGEQPQLGLVSTAHRLATSLMLTRRAAALDELDAPDVTLMIEWSPPRECEITDEAAWRMASPAWSERRERMIRGRVTKALNGGKSEDPNEPDPIEAVRAQWLNIWPSKLVLDGRGELLFDVGVWDAAEEDVEVDGPLVLAVEDWVGIGAAAAAAGVADDGRVVVGGWCFDRRVEAYGWARSYAERFPGSTLLLGASLRDDREHGDIPAEVLLRTTSDTRSALSLLRQLTVNGGLAHDGSGDIRSQVTQARVTPAAAGGLQLVNAGRLDLVRCVAWVVAEAHRSAGLVPTVHGAPS